MALYRAFLVTLVAGILCAQAAAQETEEQPGSEASPSASDGAPTDQPAALQAQKGGSNSPGPDVYYLPDKSGKLRRVMGFRYEDFVEAWRAERSGESAALQAGATLDRVEVSGTADDAAAKIKITIHATLHRDGWTGAPLKLAGAIVDEAHIEGDDEGYLSFDSPTGGYIAWFKGKVGDQRTVVIDGAVLASQDGERRRLAIELPAATESEVAFSAGARSIDVETPSGVEVEKPASDNGEARPIVIHGARGLLTLSWEPAEAAGRGLAAALEAKFETIVSVEPNQLQYDTEIELDPFGRPLHRVWLRLPKGADLTVAPQSPDYDVITAPLWAVGGGSTAPSQKVVEIRFRRPIVEPTSVHVAAKSNRAQIVPDSAAEAAPLVAAPFEVLGAYRQSGYVALRVSDQLHAHWDLDGRIEQIEVDELPERLRAGGPLAAFATNDAGWSMQLVPQRRERRMRALPRYALRLAAETASLDVNVDYQITGGRIFELRFDLRDWELTDRPIDSGGAVDLNELHITRDNILILPLKEPDSQLIRLAFSLRRPARLGSQIVALPQPLGVAVLPGEVSVASEDALRATVDVEKSSGVAANNGATGVPDFGAGALAARPTLLQTFLPAPTLAVETTRREQLVRVSSTAHANLRDGRIALQQRLTYDVRFQPLAEVSTVVGNELLGNEDFSLLLDGSPLGSDAIDVQPLGEVAAPNSAGLKLVVRLPKPLVGEATLEIRSTWPVDQGELAGTAPLSLPLAIPAQAVETVATIGVGDGSVVATLWPGSEGAWIASPSTTASTTGASYFQATSTKGASELVLQLQGTTAEAADLRQEAAWAQTWIAGGTRQDRFVYRLRTNQPKLSVKLPTLLAGGPREVLVDGQPAKYEEATPGELSITLPDEAAESTGAERTAADRSFTVEIRRLSSVALALEDRVDLTPPQIEFRKPAGPFFWQVVLPRQYMAWGASDELNPEYRVGWKDLQWGRWPVQEQRDFERWIGAARAPAPAPSMRQYVLSGLEPPASASVTVVRGIWLVVAGAAAALAAGLACLYTPLGRSPLFWGGLCVAAAVLAVAAPEFLVAVFQAIVVGAVLTAIAAVVRRMMREAPLRGSKPAVVRPSSAAIASTTQPWLPHRGDGASGSHREPTTAAAGQAE